MINDRLIDNHLKQLRASLEAVYRAGYADGASAMKDNIIKAASVPTIDPLSAPTPTTSSTGTTARAPRGLVGQVVQKVLRSHPGLYLQELEERATAIETRISPKSVTNELHRKKGELYRQEGRRWFLIDQIQDETAEAADNEPSAASV